ncbi:hypothetical protein GGF32_000108 [Allomyces javanicus]|nr:hypothetical protein GGF32_000108 [Allomyces javanicus]
MDSAIRLYFLTSTLEHVHLEGIVEDPADWVGPPWAYQTGPQCGRNLQVLDLEYNMIHALVVPFPPKLQRLFIAGNEGLSDDVRPQDWIEALPLTLRELDVRSCFLDDRVGQILVAAKERAGLACCISSDI